MKIIISHELVLEPVQIINVPWNSELLPGIRAGKVSFISDSSQRTIARTFYIYAEGKEMDSRLNKTNYVGTIQHESGPLYVFE